jgi:NAD(P)-dependent dehydrogenase (short-subunit alcohol dehydrogenase family)
MIQFAKEGATVCGVSRMQQNLAQVTAAGGQGSVMAADLSTPEGAEKAVTECLARHGA